jgi:microsomal dipeptidase-like Zn-dependent dipeptidase
MEKRGDIVPDPSKITRYEWDLGDGTETDGATVTHSYSSPGSYYVKLTVYLEDGQSGTSGRTIRVVYPGEAIGIIKNPNAYIYATDKNPMHNLESYMEHIEYCIDLCGMDYVGVGPDSYYFDHVGEYLQNIANRGKMGRGSYQRPDQGVERMKGMSMDPDLLKKLGYVKGVDNPTESTQNVARWMVHHGYSDTEISKIIGGNALSLFGKVWR